MANLIVANEIPGASVYGMAQVSYTVDGKAGNDYAAALTAAAFREATAIEVAASSYVVVVRQRQTKVSELGDVLSTIAYAMGTLKPKDRESSDPSATSWQMDRAWEAASDICKKYGLALNVQQKKDGDGWTRNYMTRGDLMTSQNEIQYAIDVEDNNLQQDMVSMQSFMTKRDSAFSTASRIVSKSLNASASALDNI